MADHGVPDNESREQPDAKRGEPASDQIDAGRAKACDPDHFLQDDEGVFFGKVMKGEAAKDQFGAFGTEGKPAGVSLDEEHFLIGGGGGTGNFEGLKLHVQGHDRDITLAGARQPNQISAVVSVTAGQIDQQEAIKIVGEFVEDFFDRLFAANSFVKPCDIFKVAPQRSFILIGQIHQLGLGFGIFALHGAIMPIVELASLFFCEKKVKHAV